MNVDGAVAGFVVGLLVAPVVDATLLAHEQLEPHERGGVAPVVLVSRQLQGVGVRGRF